MSSKHSNIRFFASPYLHDIIRELKPKCDCSKSFSPNRKWRPSLNKSDWLPRQRAETNSIWHIVNFAEKNMTKDINFLPTQDWQSLLWFSKRIRIKTLQGPIGPGGAKDRPKTAPTTAVLAPLAAKKKFFHGTSSQRINSEFTHDLISKSRESNNEIWGD